MCLFGFFFLETCSHPNLLEQSCSFFRSSFTTKIRGLTRFAYLFKMLFDLLAIVIGPFPTNQNHEGVAPPTYMVGDHHDNIKEVHTCSRVKTSVKFHEFYERTQACGYVLPDGLEAVNTSVSTSGLYYARAVSEKAAKDSQQCSSGYAQTTT